MRLVAIGFLWLMLAMNLVFGAIYLFWPTAITDLMAYGPLRPAARTDIRALFGGFQLGTGLFLMWGLRSSQVRSGVMCVMFGALGFVLCRGYGLLVDGESTPGLLGALVLEVTISVGALALIMLLPDWDTPSAPAESRGARLFVLVIGLVLAASGIASALLPVETMAPMGFDPLVPPALTDARASYGGFQLGFAGFLLWCLRARRVHAGVVYTAIAIGAVALSRMTGFVLDGSPIPAQIAAAVLEGTLAAVAGVIAWRSVRRGSLAPA